MQLRFLQIPEDMERISQVFFPQISSTKAVPQRIAHRYQIAAQRRSGVIPSAVLPVNPSIVPKITALMATKVENHANGIGLAFRNLLRATKR